MRYPRRQPTLEERSLLTFAQALVVPPVTASSRLSTSGHGTKLMWISLQNLVVIVVGFFLVVIVESYLTCRVLNV